MGTQLFCAMLNSVGQLLSFFFVVVLNFMKTKKKKGWSKCCVKRNNLCQKIVLRWWSQHQDHDSHKLFVSATCCSLLPRTPWIHPTLILSSSLFFAQQTPHLNKNNPSIPLLHLDDLSSVKNPAILALPRVVLHFWTCFQLTTKNSEGRSICQSQRQNYLFYNHYWRWRSIAGFKIIIS